MNKVTEIPAVSGVGSNDVLERAAAHLRTMAPHVRERMTAHLLKKVLQHIAELEVENEKLRSLCAAPLPNRPKRRDVTGVVTSELLERRKRRNNVYRSLQRKSERD